MQRKGTMPVKHSPEGNTSAEISMYTYVMSQAASVVEHVRGRRVAVMNVHGWCTCSTLKWKVVMPATWRLGVVPSCCVCMWSTSFFFSKVLLQAQSTCHFPHGGWRRRALIRKIVVAFLILSSKCFLTGCRAVLLTKFSLFQLTSLILTPRLWYPC